ncbi:MAG: glycoside hydrolase family 30 protein [Sphingobacteriia bacterium]|jgi:glucosylceramidase
MRKIALWLLAVAVAPLIVLAQKSNKALVVTTASNTQFRLTKQDSIVFSPMEQPAESQICVFVDNKKKFQTYIGIGAALTDASAETFYKLPAAKQEELLSAYFDPVKGIGYTIARTNINSCDFSSDMYTYVKEGDKELTSFTIEHDLKYKIPFIKASMAAAGKNLTLFASPWSPPSWMKDNNNMLQGGKLKKEFYQSWANYYAKFIKAYEKEGVPVWGITIQNEPMAKQTWESCIYTGVEETNFLKNYLGPTMVKAGLGSKKIIGWDHNRDLIYQRGSTLLNDPAAAKYLWGIGFHWYEPWSGGKPMFENLKKLKEAYPNTHLIFTEGCAESFNPNRMYAWELGEKYGLNMINDFNNGMEAFTDWNIVLDEFGGPNHVGNFCFAPVHANIKTGQLMYTNAYYYIGHFSKFLQKGAKRIISSSSRSALITTAFENPDGTLVVLVMNSSDEKIPFYLWKDGKSAPTDALPRSMNTYIFR